MPIWADKRPPLRDQHIQRLRGINSPIDTTQVYRKLNSGIRDGVGNQHHPTRTAVTTRILHAILRSVVVHHRLIACSTQLIDEIIRIGVHAEDYVTIVILTRSTTTLPITVTGCVDFWFRVLVLLVAAVDADPVVGLGAVGGRVTLGGVLVDAFVVAEEAGDAGQALQDLGDPRGVGQGAGCVGRVAEEDGIAVRRRGRRELGRGRRADDGSTRAVAAATAATATTG